MFDFLGGYWESVLTTAGALAIAAVGLQVTASTGQLSVMHGTIMGIGGYVAGWFAKEAAWPYIPTLFVAIAAGALLGLLASLVLLRLGGLILAIATLAIAEGLGITARNFFPGKAQGYTGVPLRTSLDHVILALAAVLFLLALLKRSRRGLAQVAVGSDPVAAESLGISSARLRIWGFTLGGAIAGLAGGMYVQYLSLVQPADLGFQVEINLLIFLVLGGMSTPWGPAVGAFAVTVGVEQLRFVTLDRSWILGLLLVITVLLRPAGILVRRPIRLEGRAWIPRPLRRRAQARAPTPEEREADLVEESPVWSDPAHGPTEGDVAAPATEEG